MTKTHILGFPRIGAQRELKKALEAYWQGHISQDELLKVGSIIRQTNWQIQADAGLDFITVGDFSYYDHILDTSALLGVIPARYEHTLGNEVELDTIFSMARGQAPNREATSALAMTKWFNTNYHYFVPEFTKDQHFTLSSNKLFGEISEAQTLGYNVKPVIVGPLTYLWLGKQKGEEFNKLDLLPQLIATYSQIFKKLESQGIIYLQLDEPILALELSKEWQQAFVTAYSKFDFASVKPILTTYFDDVENNLDLIKELPVAGLHIDICSAPKQLVRLANEWSKNKILSIGIVNGRNVWKNDLAKSLYTLDQLKTKFGSNLWIASSCSLLHVPVDLDNETKLNPEIRNWLAFARQKIAEIATLGKAIRFGEQAIKQELIANQQAINSKKSSELVHNTQTQERVASISQDLISRTRNFSERSKAQFSKLNLPLFPTTTIGSFPQTAEIRKIRQQYKNQTIDENQYETKIKSEIKEAIYKQESLGLDVLVHGESERNDMVEYFGESLNGFIFSQNGWVQSYGSRCVKPPIIYGDISRSKPITVEWTSYAQSLTDKEVKGMLTGPVTILSWSFIRDDQPPKDTAIQIALALRDEVADLEQAGINIIQIDEPAFREALPLKKQNWEEYLNWAVYVFKLSSSGVSDSTQIHTHMCYSSFNDVIESISALDADVITIEASRGDLDLLKAFDTFNYPNQIGPGVYDVHSPRIPESNEIVDRVEQILKYIPKENLWINPDCGLKTRNWTEVEATLQNMQEAAYILRKRYSLNL